MSSDEGLDEGVRRLAEVEAEIEELTKIERLIQKVEGLEKSIKGISDSLSTFVKKEEAEQMRKSADKETKAYIDDKMEVYDEVQGENVKRLSQIDAEIIDKLRKMERFFDEIKELGLEIKKLRDLCGVFVRKDEVEIFKDVVDEKIEKAKVPQEEMKALSEKLKSTRELMEVLARKSDLVDLRKEMKNEELEGLRRDLLKRMESMENSAEEHVRTLSQIDSEIISRIKKIDHHLEKLNEQMLTLRKLGYEEKEVGVGPKDLKKAAPSF